MTDPTVAAVLDSLARHLAAEGAATFTPNGVYGTVTTPAVFFGQLAPKPDLAVSINHYWTDPDTFTQQHHPRMRFQLRWRGTKDPRTVHHHADLAFEVLHSLTPGEWPGGLHPQWVQRVTVAPIEPDDNGRWERCDSYEIQLNPIGA